MFFFHLKICLGVDEVWGMNCTFSVQNKRYCDHTLKFLIPEKKDLFLRLRLLLLLLLLSSPNVNSNNVLHSDLSS